MVREVKSRFIIRWLRKHTSMYSSHNSVSSVFREPRCMMYIVPRRNSPGLITSSQKRKFFYKRDTDIGCKKKWDYWCYEWAPQCTWVLFGIAITFTLYAPDTYFDEEYADIDITTDNDYWEAILTYTDTEEKTCFDLGATIKKLGFYTTEFGDSQNYYYMAVRPEFVYDIHTWIEAVSETKQRELETKSNYTNSIWID